MRLNKLCLAFVFIFVIISQITAQSLEEPPAFETPKIEKPFRIGTNLGYSFAGYREETDLPLNRYADSLNVNINGNFIKNNFYFSFNYNFIIGETRALEINNNNDYFSYYQEQYEYLRISFDNALDYRLWGNDTLPGYLGGALRSDFYFSSLNETYYSSITMILSLNIHATQEWIIIDGTKLVFSVSIPFFGYAFRPPYYGIFYSTDDFEADIISFHNYRAVFGELKFYQKIFNWFSFNIGLGFELSQITFPQERRDASICINAGCSFYF